MCVPHARPPPSLTHSLSPSLTQNTHSLSRSLRYWKVPEESHLVFRSPSMAQHALALINNQEWVTGGCDGTLQVRHTHMA